MNFFLQHWLSANTVLGATPVVIGLPDKTSITQGQFALLRDKLQTQQNAV